MNNTLNIKLNPYMQIPTIINSTIMTGVTEPSLYHSEILEVILFLHRYPENVNKTVVVIHNDKSPFSENQRIVIPWGTYNATFSIERRSDDEIYKDRSIFVGLTSEFGS